MDNYSKETEQELLAVLQIEQAVQTEDINNLSMLGHRPGGRRRRSGGKTSQAVFEVPEQYFRQDDDRSTQFEPIQPDRAATDSESSQGAIYWYLNHVAKHDLLSPSEEISLGKGVQTGNPESFKRLAAGNLRLVINIAKRYMNQGMDLEDLIQEGNLGLMQAVKKFDPTRGNKFSTYATWWIKQAIARGLCNKGRTIRIPVHTQGDLFKLKRAAKPFCQNLGRYPTPMELANKAGLDVKKVESTLRSALSVSSLDALINGDDEETLSKFVEDKAGRKPEDYAEEELLERKVERLMKVLSINERRVLCHTYGIGGCKILSATQLASKLSLPVEEVRRIGSRSMRKLRRYTRNHKIADYLVNS